MAELLVEAKDGALAVNIAGTTTSGEELAVGGRRGELDARGGAGGVGAGSHILRSDTGDVASTAASPVEGGGLVRGHRRVRLGDAEVAAGGHGWWLVVLGVGEVVWALVSERGNFREHREA